MGEEYVGRYEVLLLPSRGGDATDGGDTPAPGGPPGRGNPPLSKELLSAVSADPDVIAVDPVYETTLRAGRVGESPTPTPKGPNTVDGGPPPTAQPASGPRIMGGVAAQRAQPKVPTVVGTNSPEPLHTLLQGKWFDPKNAEARDGALTREAAEVPWGAGGVTRLL